MALEKSDCDLRRGLLKVQCSEWKGHVGPTKGMETRIVPMTKRLLQALKDNDHLVSERVLYSDTMEKVTEKVIQKWMARAQKRAKLADSGGFHLLRHTFCSHLAMKGAPVLSIQKLAGHQNMQTTLRYMHLAPGETHRAIALLEGERDNATKDAIAVERGDIWETTTNLIKFPSNKK